MLIATTVRRSRSVPAGKASQRFTRGIEIRIANPFPQAVSQDGKMRKKAQSNKDTEGNAMN